MEAFLNRIRDFSLKLGLQAPDLVITGSAFVSFLLVLRKFPLTWGGQIVGKFQPNFV